MSVFFARLAPAVVASFELGCAPAVLPAPAAPRTVMETERVTLLSAEASPVGFDRIAAFPPPGWHVPRQPELSPDGKLVTYLASETLGEQMALFAWDVATRRHRVLLRASDLEAAAKPMSREEELRRERQRQRIKGITAYAWAERVNVMLVPFGGDLFVRAADGAVRRLTDSAEPELDPKICADGTAVAFARGRELFVIDVATGRERQLTSGAPAGVTRGQSDYNGQEELGEPSGHWWSPRCDRIAYLEVDERGVAEVPILGYRDGPDLQALRYPRAGAENPVVRLGVLELATGRTSWVALPATGPSGGESYLARVGWAHDGAALFLERLSRDQRRLALVRVDPASGAARHLAELEAADWVELGELFPLRDGSVLWTTRDAQGHRHLERRDGTSGAPLATLSSGGWDVSRVVGVDETRGRVLFLGNRDAPLDRQLYAVPLAGGAVERLSTEPGVHDVTGRRAALGWVDVHSAADRTPRAVVHGGAGEALGELPVPLDADFEALALRVPEMVRLDGAGGPDLHGALLKPRKLVPGARHPAVVMVYGGPGVQTVLNEWNPRPLWQHLADRGVVVFQIDNRGSTGRGHAFEAPIHLRLGEIELADQIRGLDWLCAQPYVDATRVGIYGHSYGGTMATLAMLRAPDRFRVGVAGSPVTDWRLYDSGYTERYMGTPESNPQGYAATEVSAYADRLAGKLFIVHALMDENVHFAHTAKLIDALTKAGKDFDLLLFPGERHGYRSPEARRYAYRRIVEYFAEHL